jgi:hypothetical protein
VLTDQVAAEPRAWLTPCQRLSGNLTTSLLSFQAAFWRYRKAGQERGESLFSIRLMLLI